MERKTDSVRMPTSILVGDRIRLREDCITEMRQAFKLAGWEDFDQDRVYEVIRQDEFNGGGGRRLVVEKPPFMFAPSQVRLAWNTPEERRRALREKGHDV